MFRQPKIFEDVAKGMQQYLKKHGEKSVRGLIGKAV
jgi:dihydroorotate dehydrogenase